MNESKEKKPTFQSGKGTSSRNSQSPGMMFKVTAKRKIKQMEIPRKKNLFSATLVMKGWPWWTAREGERRAERHEKSKTESIHIHYPSLSDPIVRQEASDGHEGGYDVHHTIQDIRSELSIWIRKGRRKRGSGWTRTSSFHSQSLPHLSAVPIIGEEGGHGHDGGDNGHHAVQDIRDELCIRIRKGRPMSNDRQAHPFIDSHCPLSLLYPRVHQGRRHSHEGRDDGHHTPSRSLCLPLYRSRLSSPCLSVCVSACLTDWLCLLTR